MDNKNFSQDQTFYSMQKIELDHKTIRREWSWTETNRTRGSNIVDIVNKYQEHWPMTERAIFYRLISSDVINQIHWRKNGNPESERIKDLEGALSVLLKWLRIEGYIPWHSIVDEQRTLTDKQGFSTLDDFIESELDYFLNGYRKCLAKRQPYHIEVWLEKATLRHIVEPITNRYCRRLMCCKGYNSVTFQEGFLRRAQEAMGIGMTPIVLYFGDWDPSGCDMLYAAAQTLTEEMGLFGMDFYRCGINPCHFSSIPADPVPIKSADSRARKFIEKYGPTAYELDAFEPEALQMLVDESIRTFTDLDAVQVDLEDEKKESARIRILKNDVVNYIQGLQI